MEEITRIEEADARFRDDMEEAGFEVRDYKGRFFYEGPAVVVSDLQDAIRATDIPLQWDHLGLNWIVYPRADTGRR